MPTMHRKDTVRARCAETNEGRQCEFTGTLAELELHLHTWDDEEQYPNGRCEDYPCCGHPRDEGCRDRPEFTSDFYYRNPHLMHEPGSPEWYDAMDDLEPEPEDD